MIESSDSDSPRPRPGGDKLPDSERVLAGLGKASWSEEQGVSYEVALDIVNEAIGAYSGLIGREEASPSPDAAKIASWRQAKIAWAHKRRELSPADPEAVESVRREAADLLRTLSTHE